jgi:predicted MFS family arabinose efflux permease
MFLQYAPAGALVPLFSLRLEKDLHFDSIQLSRAAAMSALANLLAPLVVGQVADRWVPAERCLTVCAAAAAVLAWNLAELTTPSAVLLASLAFWLMMVPVFTLGTSITFTHLSYPELSFGRVRLWGTVGWMVPGWLLGLWFSEWNGLPRHSGFADAFRLAAILAAAVALYGLTLPHTPPQRRAGALLAPLAALPLLRGRSVAIFALCVLGTCATLPFSTQVTPLLLSHHGVPRDLLSPTLTLAQSTEALCLGLLPMLLLRCGLRGTMLLGLGTWAVALSVLAVGRPLPLVAGSLVLHGLYICCFLVAGQVFLNSRARGDVRVSMQGLFSCLAGMGLLIGNLSVGVVRERVQGDFTATFAVAAAVTAALLLVFLLGFREEEPSADCPTAPGCTRRSGPPGGR